MSQDVVQWILSGGIFAMVGSIVTALIQARSTKQKDIRESQAATERRYMEENARAVQMANDAQEDARAAREEADSEREKAREAWLRAHHAEDLMALYRRTLIEHNVPVPTLHQGTS